MSVSWRSRQGVLVTRSMWRAAIRRLPVDSPGNSQTDGQAGPGELLGAPQNHAGTHSQKLFSTLLLIELIDETKLQRVLVGDRMRIRQDSKMLERERKDQN